MRPTVIRGWTNRYSGGDIPGVSSIFVREGSVKLDDGRVAPTKAMSFEPTEAERRRLLAGAPLIFEIMSATLPPVRCEVGEAPSDTSPYPQPPEPIEPIEGLS